MTETEEKVEQLEDTGALEGQKPGAETPASEAESRDAVIARLEQAAISKDTEIAALKQTASEVEKKLGDLTDALAKAVASYKALAIRSNPEVPAELITGNTVDEVDESIKNARAIIDRVRQEMEAQASKTRVPAGAPPRSPLDLSGLSPREKIQYAIGGKR